MADTLAEALPREIARISAKRELWLDLAKASPGMAPGISITTALMQAEINRAVKACASGDVVEMLAAYQALKDYSDDD